MAAINTGKLIVGGLVSGVVLFVFDILINVTWLGGEWEANMRKLGLDPASLETTGSFAAWIACDLMLGLVLLWIYAGIRPRFGAGPSTAIKAGLVIFVTMTVMFYGIASSGFLPMSYFFKSTLVYVVVMPVAAMAGAFFYKEN